MQSEIELLRGIGTVTKPSSKPEAQPEGLTFELPDGSVPLDYLRTIRLTENTLGIPRNLLARMIKQESDFNPNALGPETKTGERAKGIAQIMTSQHPGVDPYKPHEAIDYAGRYLKSLYYKYGDWHKAVAAYNTGPGNVDKLGMGNLPAETNDYLDKVIDKTDGGGEVSTIAPELSVLRQSDKTVSELDLLREPTTNPEAPYYAQNLANYLTEAAKPKQVPMQAPVFPGETNPITGLPKTEQLPVSPNQPVTQPSPLMQQAKEFLAGVWDVAKSVPGAVGGGVVGGVVGGPIGSALGAGLGVQLEESYDAWKAGDLPRLADLATGGLFTSTIQHGGNAVDALTHLKPTTAMAEIAKSVPFFGPMAAQVEQYLKEGKYSRAAGLTAGLAIVPKVGEKVHGAVISKAANFVANEVDRMTTEANAKAVEISKNPDEVAKQAQLVVLKDQLDKDTKAVLDSGAIDAVVEDDLSVRAHEVEQIKQTQAQPKPITKEELVQIAKDYLAEKKAKAPPTPEPPVPGTLAQPTPEKPLEGPTPYTGPERRGPQQPTLYIGPRRRTTDQIIQEAMEAEQKKPVEVTTEPTPPVPSKIEQTGEPSITAEEIARLDKINPDWDLLSNEELSKLLGRELGPEPTKAEPITEVDLQTGTPEPPALATQDSPFREKDATATKSRTEIYGKSKSVANNLDELFNQDPTMPTKNPATTLYKLTNDINRYLDGEPGVDVEGTRNFLSELAANVDDFRNQFGDAQSFNQFKTLVSETAKWARNGDRSKISQTIPTTSLYSGLDPFEAARRVRDLFKGKVTPGEEIPSASSDIIKAGREIANYTKMARDIKSFNLKDIIGKTRQELALALLERSGTIRRQMLDQLGERGYDIVQRMYLARGATARATNMLRQMRNEVYSGLSSNERKILDDLILDVRMIDISGYKTEKQFRPPKPIINFKIHKQLFAYKEVNGLENLTPERAAAVENAAKVYYEWMKKPLTDMLDEGLISDKEYADLVAHNYRRIGTVDSPTTLADLIDKKYDTRIGNTKRSIYDSGIERLAMGKETDIYEPSSEIMALETFNRAYGRIMNNQANRSLLELARADKSNPFVRVKEAKTDPKIPAGWSSIFVYEKGVRKTLHISPEMSREWITSSKDISPRMAKLLRYGSLSPITRTFATGIEWAFALANVPRDVMQIWFAARTFENGKWTGVYNPTIPGFAGQMSFDMARVFSDALLRKGRLNKYIEEGGGMDFLTIQGSPFRRGLHLESPAERVFNAFAYPGTTSELLTRLAIRERVIRNKAKQLGIKMDEANANPKITREATFAARDYMDFAQGGWFSKAADQAIPYLNASTVGIRGFVRAFQPGSGTATVSMFKLAQVATAVTGIYLATKFMQPKTAQALKNDINTQNSICIPLGDGFAFEDEKGQIRYPYIKIPIDQNLRFFKKFFEASADKWLGEEIDVDGTVNALQQLSPVGISSLPATVSGPIGYAMNKDFWRNQDIWRKTDKPFSWPNSKEEFIPGQTPQAAITAGKYTGLSPERTRYMLGRLIANSMWADLVGLGYDKLFGDLPKDQKEQHLAEVLSKTPGIRRFFGITNPYSQYGQAVDEEAEKSAVQRYIETRGLDALVDGYLFKGNTKKQEVINYIKGFKDPDIQDRLYDRFDTAVDLKDLPNRSFWMRMQGLPTDARARIYVREFSKLGPAQQTALRREMAKVDEVGGILSDSFWDEVAKIQRPLKVQ